MRVPFGEKLRRIQRTPFFDYAVNQEMVFAPEQDDVPATHVLNGDFSDQGDVLGLDPRLHTGAMNAQGNPAVALERSGDLQHIVRATLTADSFQLLPVFFPILHEAPMPKFQTDAKQRVVQEKTSTTSDTRVALRGGAVNGQEVPVAQSYSIEWKQLMEDFRLAGRCSKSVYERRGAPLQMPP